MHIFTKVQKCNVNKFFLSEGHTIYSTTDRGPDTLGNVIVSGYVIFYQIIKFFVNILFFHYWQIVFIGQTNWLCGLDVAC